MPHLHGEVDFGEPLNGRRRMAVATDTIYHDRDHPSYVILPIIPHS